MRQLIRLGIQRSPASFGLVAIMALGMIVTATLLASAPIYARSMSDLGLTYAIRNGITGKPYSEAMFFSVPLGTPEGEALQNAVGTRLQQRLGWFSAGPAERAYQLGRFVITEPGTAPADRDPLGQPSAINGFASHVRVVQGRLPRETATGSPIEVTVSSQGARAANVKPGDQIQLNEEFDNCERELPSPGAPPPPPCPVTTTLSFAIPAVVVGIVEPADPTDAFWSIPNMPFFDPYTLPIDGAGPIVPMLMDPTALVNSFGKLYPGYVATMSWTVTANPATLTRTNYQRAAADITGLGKEFTSIGGFGYSPLLTTLNSFNSAASYQQTPLLILLLELTGIALFYVIIVSSLVVERQSGEIALLRSRGATIWQVALLYIVEGLVFGVVAFLVAPFLAAGATALLGLTPPFHDVTGGKLLPVTIVPLALPLAAIGVVLSIAAFVLPAALAARQNAVVARRAEARPRRPFVQRYYLDFALAAVAILLLFELHQRGSVFKPSPSGSLSSDPLLLASPALTIVAAAAILLRVYPWVLRAAGYLARKVAGPELTLGLWQSVRNPGQYLRLTLLLMMAVAVGTFAASYTATANRSYADRANFTAGADVRALKTNGADAGVVQGEAAAAAKLKGVGQVSPVVRTTGALAGPGVLSDQFQVLGLDPSTAPQLLWSRSDLANQPLSDLIARVNGPSTGFGIPLDGKPSQLSIHVRSSQALSGVTLWAGVVDASGRFALVQLAELDTIGNDYQAFTADISGPDLSLQYPVTVESVEFSGQVFEPSPPTVYLAGFAAIYPDGHTVPIDLTQSWSATPHTAPNPDTVEVAAGKGVDGGDAVAYTFHDTSLSSGLRGIYYNNLLTPLPAVVSDSFLKETGVREGGTALLSIDQALTPIQVVGTFHLFPTTDEGDGPVVVVDRDWLVRWSQMVTGGDGTSVAANELWLQLRPGADSSGIATALTKPPFSFDSAVTRASALQDAKSNPLIAASGTGILLAAFIAILILVAVAILASLLAAMTRRQVEFAVVRALGLSRGQFFRMLILEYSLVFIVGVAAGAPLGLFISDRMLGFLNVTQTGAKVAPPFILQTHWSLVGVGVGIVLSVFAVALAVAGMAAVRVADGRALRGE